MNNKPGSSFACPCRSRRRHYKYLHVASDESQNENRENNLGVLIKMSSRRHGMKAVVVVVVIAHVLLCHVAGGGGGVPAVIVFGDSTADTGNNNFIQTMARGNYPPYGRDFAGGVATGRFSNGRLAADFVSEALGLPPAVPPYLDPSHSIHQLASGVSFASAGTGLDNITAQILVSI